ncbi:MAG TPA: hypothetical protein VH134_15975 [Candidatus Dormibacteraeota bacterium]|jgi:hypothetical protein|nr:hypothetical protein [Candidatus Dormibacteraeota bacterium]
MRARVVTWADRNTDAAKLEAGQGFYVSVNDGDEHGLLVGPFDRLEEALGMLERAQTVAEAVDQRAERFTYGVCRAPTREPGLLNGKLGVEVPPASAG